MRAVRVLGRVIHCGLECLDLGVGVCERRLD